MVIGHTRYHSPRTFWQGIDALDYFSQRALGTAFIGIGFAYTCAASIWHIARNFIRSTARPLIP